MTATWTEQWEYRIENDPDETALAELGESGWELVGVAVIDTQPRCYFKRPRPSLKERITLEQRGAYIGTED